MLHKKHQINILQPLGKPSLRPPINYTPSYRTIPNKTTTYKTQEVIKESKVYVENNFQDHLSKLNANLFLFDIINTFFILYT